MSPPPHIKAIVGLANAILLPAGLRDIFMPGTGLPLPDDDKTIAAVFGAPPVGACGKKDVGCVPGRMLFISQLWGMFVVTLTLVKLVTVFTHNEGTFLRKNLFFVLGACELLSAYVIFSHESYFASQGATAMPFVGVFALEGGVLLADALMRERMPKTKKLK